MKIARLSGLMASFRCQVVRPGHRGACIPINDHTPARVLARMWTLFGDQMRDEAALMQAVGLEIIEKREFGAFHSIRITVERKKDAD